jgi:hypothetical protein
MTRAEIDRLLGESAITWNLANADERKMFARAMRGRRYGYDALRDAMEWYFIGWRGHDIYWQERERAAGE